MYASICPHLFTGECKTVCLKGQGAAYGIIQKRNEKTERAPKGWARLTVGRITQLEAEGYSTDPTLGRQVSNRLSTRVSNSIPSIPVSANTRTPTKTLSVWKVAPATVIINPMPAVAA